MWDEETLINDFRELLEDSIKKMQQFESQFGEKMIKGYTLGMTDAITLFYRQVGKWEILFEMRKESLKEK